MKKDIKVRAVHPEALQTWWFCAVDLCAVLTGHDYEKARVFWNNKKRRYREEQHPLMVNTHMIGLKAKDGKQRLTEVLTTEQAIYLIMTIKNKKAEPLRLWLAETASRGEIGKRLEAVGEKNADSTLEEIKHLHMIRRTIVKTPIT